MRSLPIQILAAAALFAGTASAQTVLFIGNANAWGGPANSGDGAILTFLQTRYGAANVTYQDTEPNGSVTAETVLGYDVVVLSATPNSGRYRNILHNTPAPVVNMEEAVADNSTPGEFAITTGRTKEIEVDHKITIKTAHPITAGFPVNSTVQIMSGALPGQEVWWSTGPQAAGAVSLAEDDDTPANTFLTYVEAGATLLDNTTAPCRRVMFGMTDRTFNSFTAAGQQIFGQAVDWAAAECCAQSSNYGAGLAGTNGIPALTLDARPVYLTTVNLLASNSSGVATSGLVIVSQTPAAAPFPGGTMLTSPVLLLYMPMPAAGIRIPIPIPDHSVLCPIVPGTHLFYFQAMQLDAAAPQGVSMSQGLRMETGR